MSKFRRVTSPDVAEPPPETWSNCLVAGNTVYIAGLTAREVWKARKEFFEGNFPISTLVEVSKLADPAITVEIDAIAILG